MSIAAIVCVSCSSHTGGHTGKPGKDTTYIIPGKEAGDSSEVKVTDGDTIIEEMELNRVLPIAR